MANCADGEAGYRGESAAIRPVTELQQRGADDGIRVDPDVRWQALLSSTHVPFSTRIDGDAQRFGAAANRWLLDDIMLVDGWCDPCSGSRSARRIKADDNAYFVMLLIRGGRETVSQGPATSDLQAGDLITWDSSQPSRFAVRERVSKRSLFVPRSAIAEVAGDSWARPGIRLCSATPSVALLIDYLAALSANATALPPSAIVAARNATLQLLRGALVPERRGAATRSRVLRDAAESFIEHNLSDPALGAGMIAHAHGVSVRTVDRAFRAADTSVGEVIRRRRLARARDDLTATDLTVAAIAGKWGFSDTSHLSRAFKARYGCRPSQFRERRLSSDSTGAELHSPVRTVHGGLR